MRGHVITGQIEVEGLHSSIEFDFEQNRLQRHIARLLDMGRDPVQGSASGDGQYEWSKMWLIDQLPDAYAACGDDVRDGAIVESLINIIASPRNSAEVRDKALVNLQCAPIGLDVAQHAVEHIAKHITNLHQSARQPASETTEALTVAFYTVAGVSQPNMLTDLVDYQIQTIRDSYLGTKDEGSRAAIQELGKVIEISDDSNESEVVRRYDVADYINTEVDDGVSDLHLRAKVGKLATSAVSTAVAASILVPNVAVADAPQRSLSGSGMSNDAVISRMFTDISTADVGITKVQIASQPKAALTSQEASAVASKMFSTGDHPLAAQTAAVMSKPKANPEKILNKFTNGDIGGVNAQMAAQQPEDLTGLTPEAIINRRSLEQFGRVADDNQKNGSERAISSHERKLMNEVRDELSKLEERVARSTSEHRISAVTAEHIRGTLLPLLRESVDDPAYITTSLSADEREGFVLDERFGSREVVDKVIEDLDDKSSIVQWARSMDPGGAEDEFDDGLVALMLYGGIEAATLSKPEINALIGIKYAEVPEFVNTKIEKTKTSGIDKVDITNYMELSDEVRFESLVKTMDELNQRALKDRQSGASFGGWTGDIRELAQIYWDVAKRHDNPLVTAEILMAQGFQESKFDPTATSPVGAAGPAQFMPATVADYKSWMGNNLERYPNGFDPRDPAQAIDAQAIYMIWTSQFANGDTLQSLLNQTLAGYNAGVGHLQRLGDTLVYDGLYINGSLTTTEPVKYQQGINSYLQFAFSNAKELNSSQRSEQAVDEAESMRIEKLHEQGFTELAENMSGDAELTPMTIDRGTKWGQYISQNAEAIKQRLEAEGLDPNLGSLHMCGLVTIDTIAISEVGDVATDEKSMNKVYDQLIETYIWARNHGVFTDPNGGAMWHAKMVDLADHLGLDVQTLPELSYPEIVRAFNNGVPYITINTNPQKLDANSPFKSGHIYAIDGVTKDGKLTIIDPASYERTQTAYDPEQLLPYADATAVHAMSAPGKMDSYIDAVAADKAEAEQEAKEKAEKEAAKKAAAEKKAKEKAEREERERQEKAEDESHNQTEQDQSANELDPTANVDGWAIRKQLEAQFPVSGTLPSDMLVVPVPGLYEQMGDRQEVMFTKEAAASFRAMNEAHRAYFGKNIVVNDAYRSYASQEATAAEVPHLAAAPGTSPHGYGGVDVAGMAFGNAEYNWFVKEGPKFGWYNPVWMDPNSTINPAIKDVLGIIPYKKSEPWHLEFYGTSDVIDVFVGGHSYYDMKAINKIRGRG